MDAFLKCVIVYLVCFQLCSTEGQSDPPDSGGTTIAPSTTTRTTRQCSNPTSTVQESQEAALVCVTFGTDTDPPELNASVTATGGSATSEDFVLHMSQAEVTPSVVGQVSVCTVIGIIDDDVIETTESFTVEFTLSRSRDGRALQTCSVEVFILDDDLGCSDSSFTFSESQSGGDVDVCIPVRVAGGSSNVTQVLVEVAVSQANATSGQDFELQDQFVQVDETEEAVLVLEACATIRIIDNTEFETTEFFTLEYTLRNSSNTSETLATCSARVLILDDDIGCSDHLLLFSESEGQPEICIAVDGVPENDTIISPIVTVTEGAATSDDFQLSEPATLRSTEEGVQACTTVEILDDEEAEGEERFAIELTLSRPAIGNLSAAIASCFIEVRILDGNIECVSDTVTYSENAGRHMVCVATRGNHDDSQITVNVTTDGNATREEDFQIFNQPFFVEPQTAMEEVQACTRVEIIDDEVEETMENFIIEFQLTRPPPPATNISPAQATCSVEVWIMDDDMEEDDNGDAGGGDSPLVYATAGAAGGIVVVLSVIATVVVAVTITRAIKRKHLPTSRHNTHESETIDSISTSDNKAYGVVARHSAAATNELIIMHDQTPDEPEYDYVQ